jgi:hypothetical protein
LIYYDIIQDKAVISIDYQSQNLKILDFIIDKEFEIIYYLCSNNFIYFFNALETIKNNKYSSTDSKYWFRFDLSDVSSKLIDVLDIIETGKLFYDNNNKILIAYVQTI